MSSVLHENPAADSFQVVLYGSLAKTGIGHGTDAVIKSVFPRVEIVCDESTQSLPHPNTMDLFAFLGHKEIARMRIYSVGGGSIRIEGRSFDEGEDVYTLQNFSEIRRYCERNGLRLSDYVFASEGPNIKEYLSHIWQAMKSAISAGLKAQGVLPGGLGVERKARFLYRQKHIDESAETRENRLVCAYAFAVSEQNAAGETIVTAPTCGACGVLPAVLRYVQEKRNFSEEQILRALAAGGLIGNLIKTNASISGAECGCQAEIGSACCMAAAALGELYEMELGQIEYASEIAMEHHWALPVTRLRDWYRFRVLKGTQWRRCVRSMRFPWRIFFRIAVKFLLTSSFRRCMKRERISRVPIVKRRKADLQNCIRSEEWGQQGCVYAIYGHKRKRDRKFLENLFEKGKKRLTNMKK